METNLREEYKQLHSECQKLVVEGAKRELTAEERENLDKRYARMDAIKAIHELEEKQRKYAADAFDNGLDALQSPQKSKAQFDYESQDGSKKVNFKSRRPGLDMDPEILDAVNHYCRTGMLPGNRSNFTVISTSASGLLLPAEVLPPISVRRLPNAWRAAKEAYGLPVLSRSRTDTTNLPVFDDTANTGAAQSENASSGTQVDVDATGTLSIPPTLYTSKQQFFSNTTALAQDFDIFTYIFPILQRRLDKGQESAWTTVAKTATTGKTTASATGVTYSETLDWEHSLAPAYRADGVYVVSDSLYRIVRGIVDGNSRPIMDNDPQNVFQKTLHGKPIIVSDYFDTVAAGGHTSGAFVSAEAITIVDAGPRRLVRYERDSKFPDQTGFEIFQNGDCKFVSAGIRLLKHPVT